ncbi:putative protein without homology [Propionibacterium freudenreichii subsp. shermanii]|nr:putative protein without homology [Propionibacterium freudenreichii subsp. shermanii]
MRPGIAQTHHQPAHHCPLLSDVLADVLVVAHSCSEWPCSEWPCSGWSCDHVPRCATSGRRPSRQTGRDHAV